MERYGEEFRMNDGSAAGIAAYVSLVVIFFIMYAVGEAIKNYSPSSSKEEEEISSFEAKILHIQDNPSRFIDTIQVMTTLMLFISGYYYINLLMNKKQGIILIVLLLYLLLSVGILLPKQIAKKYPTPILKLFLGIVQIFMVILFPLTWLIQKTVFLVEIVTGIHKKTMEPEVTEEEILAMVNEGQEQGVLPANEAEMINNIIELADKEARNIMTNRNNIAGLDANMKIKDALWEILNNDYSRYPVYEDNIDHIIGILHIKDLVRAQSENPKLNKTLKETPGLIRTATFVPETKMVDALFEEMQATKKQMVIVVDEYGQTSGLLAMEDILEEIVGNIQDEYDRESHMIQKNDKEQIYTIDGLTRLEDLSEEFGIDFGDSEFETINGLMTSLMEKIPEENDSFEYQFGEYVFKILSVENKVIKSIQVTPVEHR